MEKLEARYACMFQTLRELEGKEQEFQKYVMNILKQRAYGLDSGNRFAKLEKNKHVCSSTNVSKTLTSSHGSIEKLKKASV